MSVVKHFKQTMREQPVSLLRQLGNLVVGEAERENRLVAAAQRGNREAYDALIRIHQGQLRGFLARRVGPTAADDVLQETWLAAWQALPRFSKRSRFRSWLYGIAFHKSMDFHRAKTRMPVELPLEETLPGSDIDDWSASAELRSEVLLLVAELPDEQREVVDLYYYGELTLSEIALELNRNLNTVKSQFYRSHAAIALQFERKSHDGSVAVLLARGR
jgi:RNA polymerase sigma-70 factor (ECF subfamily)